MMIHILLSISLLFSSCLFASDEFFSVNSKELIAFKSPIPKRYNPRSFRRTSRRPTIRRSLIRRDRAYENKVKSCVNKYIVTQGLGLPLLEPNQRYGRCPDCRWSINPIRAKFKETSGQRALRDCRSRIYALKRVAFSFYLATRISQARAINITGPTNRSHWPVLRATNLRGRRWNRLKDELLRAYIDGRWYRTFPSSRVVRSRINNCYAEQVEEMAQEGILTADEIRSLTRINFARILGQTSYLNYYSEHICNPIYGGKTWLATQVNQVGYEDIQEHLSSFPQEQRAECSEIFKASLIIDEDEKIAREKKRYYQCYQQFTMKRLSTDDPRLQEVIEGNISGTEACMDLLSEANLAGGPDSSQWPMEDEDSEDGKAVLKTFNDLHRTWFTSIEYPKTNSFFNTEDLLENGEAGLFYTRSLFADGVGYDEVLKGDSVLGGIRQTSFEDRNKNDHTGHLGYYLNAPSRGFQNDKNDRATFNITGYSFGRDMLNSGGFTQGLSNVNRWKVNSGVDGEHESRNFITSNAPIVETGILTGIRNRSKQYQDTQLRNYCGMYSSVSLGSPWYRNGYGGTEGSFLFQREYGDDRSISLYQSIETGRGLNVKLGQSTPTDLFKSSGGGAMGSHAFVLQNMDITFPKYTGKYRIVANSGVKLQRRWAKRVLSDFLCREVPVINSDDLVRAEYVDVSSSIPFRKNIQCMGCHATMDQMASTARNVVIEQTSHEGTMNLAYPTLGPDELCAPTVELKDFNWINGRWTEVDNPRRTDLVSITRAGDDEAALPESFKENLCIPKNFADLGPEKARKAFWPNSGDAFNQREKCNKEGDIESFSHPNFQDVVNEKWPEETVRNYHRTRPTGKFLFREYDKTVEDDPIDVDVLGVAGLAEQVRETSDFYACGAKRYLHFLTGISTPMVTEGLSTQFNPTELIHRKILKCLGPDLKRTNNPKETIRKIIASDFYLNPDILNVEKTDEDQVDLAEVEREATLENVQGILGNQIYGCSGCHGGIDNWAEDDFSNAEFPIYGRDRRGTDPVVVPGDPCGSQLIKLLKNKDQAMELLPVHLTTCNQAGDMPQYPDVNLSTEEILTLYYWILNMPPREGEGEGEGEN